MIGYFSVEIEVWRRAYFKKGRPKSETVVFKAHDNAELLRFVKIHAEAFYGNRRWQVKSVREITREQVVATECGRELTTMTETMNRPTKPNEPDCTECSRLASRVEELEKKVEHWKANHAECVRRKRVSNEHARGK